MKILSTYKVKIKTYNHIFRGTVEVYRHAVDFLIDVCLKEWVEIKKIDLSLSRQQYVERLCHFTKKHPETVYDFDKKFYKFPSFLRRAAINEAIGKVSSYKSNLKTGKRKIQTLVDEDRPFQEPVISIHACIERTCTSGPEPMKQRSRCISEIPGTG